MTSCTRCAFMLLLLLAAACSGSEEDKEAAVITDPEGYTLALPSGWDVSKNFQDGVFIRADITRGDDMGIQIRLTNASPGTFASTAETMITDYTAEMSAHWGGQCRETEREIITAGDEALSARFQSVREDGQQWYLQLSLVRKGSMLLIFQCGCRWEDRQEGQEAFDGTVESVRFD